MEQVMPSFIQAGSLGAIFFIFVILYKLAAEWMKLFFEQRKHIPSPYAVGELSYNDQMARIIYDVSKTLSEVAVSNKQIINQLEKVVEASEIKTAVIEKLIRTLGIKYGVDIDAAGDD